MRALIAAFGQLRNSEKRELFKRLGAEAVRQVGEGFQQQRDPYGTPWKKTIRGGQILRDSGRMRNRFAWKLIPRGFKVTNDVKYVRVHQYGAVIKAKDRYISSNWKGSGGFLRFRLKHDGSKKRGAWIFARQVTIPKRQMVPEGRLGGIWSDALYKETIEYLDSLIFKALAK